MYCNYLIDKQDYHNAILILDNCVMQQFELLKNFKENDEFSNIDRQFSLLRSNNFYGDYSFSKYKIKLFKYKDDLFTKGKNWTFSGISIFDNILLLKKCLMAVGENKKCNLLEKETKDILKYIVGRYNERVGGSSDLKYFKAYLSKF